MTFNFYLKASSKIFRKYYKVQQAVNKILKLFKNITLAWKISSWTTKPSGNIEICTCVYCLNRRISGLHIKYSKLIFFFLVFVKGSYLTDFHFNLELLTKERCINVDLWLQPETLTYHNHFLFGWNSLFWVAIENDVTIITYKTYIKTMLFEIA